MYHNKNSNNRIKNKGELFIWGFVLVVLAAIAVGDVEQGLMAAGAQESIDAMDVDVSSREGISVNETIQSITFDKGSTIKDGLRVLSAMYKKNIVPSVKVEGVLGFTRLYNVTFEEAMDAILGENFRYVQKGNVTKVYTREEYRKIMEDTERMINKVFTLYYISAAEAKQLIGPVLSSVGTIKSSTPAETVVPTGESISAGSAGGDSMALNDTIVIRDYPEKIAAAEELLKELDIRPKQVLVEATILSALLDEDTKFGINWSTIEGVAMSSVLGIAAAAEAGAEQIGFAPVAPSVTSGLRVGVTKDKITALITALEEVTDTTILANPEILAVNKQLGQVYIGTKIGYVSQTTQTDTSTTQQVEFLETGTKLSFRPYIGDDGYIRMDIHPKDSSGTLKGNNIPDESSTELMTNIMVKDGQTVVIGGLFRDVVTASRWQIPLVGDIPLIGGLFRGTSDLTQREEVIVMLTPHIIEEPEETAGDEAQADIERKKEGVRKGLQWIGRRRLAEDRYEKAVRLYKQGYCNEALAELDTVLNLRPTYLEALRLKERIIRETAPDDTAMIERIMLDVIEREESNK